MAELTMGQKLAAYGDAAEVYLNAQAEYDEAAKSLDPLKEVVDKAREAVKQFADELGSDPLKVLKGSGTGRGGPRGPRDPDKRARVLEAVNGATVADIVEHVNATYGEGYVDKQYVNGVIASQRNKAPESISADGERGSKMYTYIAPAVTTPVAA